MPDTHARDSPTPQTIIFCSIVERLFNYRTKYSAFRIICQVFLKKSPRIGMIDRESIVDSAKKPGHSAPRWPGLAYLPRHCPCMGQPEQPPPQEPQEPPQICFPAFLSKINRRTIKATTPRRTSTTTMDPRFACSQDSIRNSSFHRYFGPRRILCASALGIVLTSRGPFWSA